jgi:hypothetical protein
MASTFLVLVENLLLAFLSALATMFGFHLLMDFEKSETASISATNSANAADKPNGAIAEHVIVYVQRVLLSLTCSRPSYTNK